MFNLKPELREGETVLGEYGTTVYMVRGNLSTQGSNIRLWLTNQRLILKAGLGPQRTLPLYALTNIREEKVGWHTMLRLEFATGQLEWFTVENQAHFIELLRSTQAAAPVIPEAVTPGTINPMFGRLAIGMIAFFVIAMGCVLMAMVFIMVAFGAVFYLSATH